MQVVQANTRVLVNVNKRSKYAQLDEWKENESAEYICEKQFV